VIYKNKPQFGLREKDVRREAMNVLDIHRFFVFHNLQSLGCYKGIPDLIAIKDGVTLFIELKNYPGISAGKRVNMNVQSEHQKVFERKVKENGGKYMVVRCGYDLESLVYELGLEHKPIL
jgi:Holliday junction resolvase